MAKSDSVAEGESETMRRGLRGIATFPLAAITVIGKSPDGRAAWDDETSSVTSTAAAASNARERRNTNPPSARGSVGRRTAGLLTRGSPSAAFPAGGQWRRGGGHLPSQRRDRPGLAPGSLSVRRLRTRDYHRADGPEESRLGLDSRGRLGGGDLRLLVDPEPRDGPRHVGSRPAQARARDRVRDPRLPARPRRAAHARTADRHRVRLHRRVPPDFRRGTRGRPARRGDRRGGSRDRPARPASARPVRAVAIDVDGALADTRPLWCEWLDDVARRARVDLPEDASPALLDERLGNWRALLERYAEDHGPVHFRRNADAAEALRRLQAAGVVVGAFKESPEPLARVALAQLGASRRIGALEAGPDVLARL